MEAALEGQEGEVNVKVLFYLLQLLDSYLSDVVISKENIWKILNPKIIKFWLSQLKVQNKYIRRQT